MSTSTLTTEAGATAPTSPDHSLLWRRAQAVSGLFIAVFLGIHLLNVPLAAFPGAYDAFQAAMRQFYQSPFLEIPFLFVPIGVHLAAGVRAMLRHKTRAAAKTWPQRLHRWSAWFLLAAIIGHVWATRGSALLTGSPPEQLGVAMSMHWLPYWFWPYYFVLGLAGLVHLGYGIPRALSVVRKKADRASSSRGLALTLAALGVAIVVGVLGIGGALYEIGDPFATPYADWWRGMESPIMPAVPEAGSR